MPSSSGLWNLKCCIWWLLICSACSNKNSEQRQEKSNDEPAFSLQVDTIPTINALKLELTREYCKKHYGLSDYRLDTPRMVVIHYTAIPTLEQTLSLFKMDEIASTRKYINQFSSLNVGIHYVVDQDGRIYHLHPDTVIARHIIGFNHVSIGIENIAGTEKDLTPAQLESNIELVRALKIKHPDIEFLIGHDEYNNDSLPHYKLFKSLDPKYQPYDKPDPGAKFMTDLRQQLFDRYSLEFLD